jgi:GAF domain-containing protein
MEGETIAEVLLQYALDLTQTQTGAVLLPGSRQDTYVVMAQQGYPKKAFNDLSMIHHGITGRVLREGKAVCCNDAATDADYMPLVADTCSQLSVPMIWKDHILGAITLESSQTDHFDEERSGFVTQLANQVIFAIENARLFQDAAEGRDRMQAILNTMTEALILIDRHEHIALANPRVAMLGLDSQSLVGAPLGELLAESELDLVGRLGFESAKDILLALRELHGPSSGYVYTLTSGKAPLHIQREIIPVEDEQGEVIGILLAFHDETTRYNLDRARDEFSQMIIHDLRSPLTAVTSSVMLLPSPFRHRGCCARTES